MTLLYIIFWAGLIGLSIAVILWIFFLWLFATDEWEEAAEQYDNSLIDTTEYNEEEYRI